MDSDNEIKPGVLSLSSTLDVPPVLLRRSTVLHDLRFVDDKSNNFFEQIDIKKYLVWLQSSPVHVQRRPTLFLACPIEARAVVDMLEVRRPQLRHDVA